VTQQIDLTPSTLHSFKPSKCRLLRLTQEQLKVAAYFTILVASDNGKRMSSKHSETTNEAIELAVRSTDGAIHIEPSMSVPADDGAQEKKKEIKPSQDRQIIYIIYISAAAILGACLRVYMDRFFGGDCEDNSVDDFLTPVSSHICLTSSGRTLQTGGALFRDLPANILGSFIMGLVSSKAIRIPWLRKDHPLQKDDVYHVMISTGFCGSLTTFASWNTQMVAMMVGVW
jgi:fluoride ion exporter CrcB/FEX